MPKPKCCNPLGIHTKAVFKQLRKVSSSSEFVKRGLVNEGDLICSNCPKSLKSQDTSLEESCEQNENVLNASLETTTDEGETSSDREHPPEIGVKRRRSSSPSALDKTLSALGTSPIKTHSSLTDMRKHAKIRKKLGVLQKELEEAYGVSLPERMDHEDSERLAFVESGLIYT